jgi:hypothetical protein
MRRVRFVLTALAIAGLTSGADAQGTADYTRIVRHYQSGAVAESIDALLRWSRGDVDNAVHAGITTLSGDEKIAAAMLHTEAANVLVTTQPSLADFHVTAAARLLDAAGADSAVRERARNVAREWRYFLVGLYTAAGRPRDAAYHARIALQDFPRDPLMYVASGGIAEWQSQFAGDIRRDRPVNVGIQQRVESQLRIAVSGYLKALTIDSHVALAHLHIGWIRLFLHDDDRARPELEAALADANDDTTRYLAHLFLGGLAERKRPDDARREYEAAVAVGPRYQSGYVALSRVEDTLGHHEHARALALLCAQLQKYGDDPWWDYRLKFDREALKRLRADAMHR